MKRLALALVAALFPALAGAQSYPAAPVHIINPFTAGGPVDLVARAVAQQLSQAWGQPVLVETRAGAAGNIGITYVARQPADGHTLLVMPTGNAVVNPHLYAKLPYDTLRDFAPVTLLATVENVLVVHPSVKADSVKELIELAKANPGKLTYGSPGIGSQAHVAGALLSHMAGIELLHVPYKGMAPAMNDLLGGQISFMFLSMSSALKQVSAGSLKALAVASAKRSPAAPDLPTVAEHGLGGFEAVSWYALMAPAGTPPAVVSKIAADAAAAVRQPEVRERLVGLGANPVGNSPAELEQLIRRESAYWAEFMKKTGLKAE
jgi:tripartite-type tricarboxylate transporter receptor subunit TctC